MDWLWIPITIVGGVFQALRMAMLKVLNRHVSGMLATCVRVMVGLPLMLLNVGVIFLATGEGPPEVTGHYLALCLGTALSQFFGTVLFLYLFTLGNFAVGFMLIKIDVVFAALIGTALFSEHITGKGWIAIAVTVLGVVVVSLGKLGSQALAGGGRGVAGAVLSRSTQVGVLVGLTYAMSYLFLREAMLVMPKGTFLWRSGWTLAVSTSMQLVFVAAWLALKEPRWLTRLLPHWRLAVAMGTVSMLGSVCWFAASVLQNASYVAAVAQTQVIFAIALSWWWFNERIHPLELAGMVVIVAGVLLFRL